MVDSRAMDNQIAVSKAKALSLYDGNQAALARALGVSRQYINRLPDGDLPEWMALKLCFVLNPGQLKGAAKSSSKPRKRVA